MNGRGEESERSAAGYAGAVVSGSTLSLVPGWEPVTTQTATVPREEIS